MSILNPIRLRSIAPRLEDGMVEVAKVIREETQSDLVDIVIRVAKVFKDELDERIQEITEEFEGRLAVLQEGYEVRVHEMISLLQHLPTPMVQVNTNPVIRMSVPEQKRPIVNNVVNVPKRGKLIKDITYDEHGRPAKISEQEA